MSLPLRVATASVHAHSLFEHAPALNEFMVSGTDNAVNLLLGGVFFVWSLLQQNGLQNSVHFTAVVCCLFVAFAAIGWLQKRIGTAVATGGLRSVVLERYTLGMVAIASGYLGGLLSRLIVDQLTNGPHVGVFGLDDLLAPFIVIVCLTSLFAQLRIVTDSYARVSRAIAAER